MSARFEPSSYPGARPDGPVIVHQGTVRPVQLHEKGIVAPDDAAGARVLTGGIRWSVAYGANADPDRLIDKALDLNGALLLPARLRGWRTAWEARRAVTTGAVPLTLVPAPGAATSDVWVLGVHPDDTLVLDASEGRDARYTLGRVGPVAVADRYLLADALAYGPGRATRCLTVGSELACHPALAQADAGRLLERGAVALAADPLPRPVPGPWPSTPLVDLPLFLYGTLQPGGSRWETIADLVEVVGAATTVGTVVATFYGYPAATFGGAGRVHGTLVRPRGEDAARILYPRVDAIEEAPRLFRRRAVTVRLRSRDVWAAAYAWNRDQGEPPGTPVPDGRWTA